MQLDEERNFYSHSDILRLNFKSFRNFYLILAKKCLHKLSWLAIIAQEREEEDRSWPVSLQVCVSSSNNSCVKEKFVAILDLIICEAGMIELNYFVQLWTVVGSDDDWRQRAIPTGSNYSFSTRTHALAAPGHGRASPADLANDLT